MNDHVGRPDPKSPFYPKSESVFDLGIIATKKAASLLDQNDISMDIFSGKPKIYVQQEKDQLFFPEHLESMGSESEKNLLLEKYVLDLLIRENLSIKLETPSFGGIFKWLPKDEVLLLITVYKLDPSRSRQRKAPKTMFSLKCRAMDRQDSTFQSYPKQLARLLYFAFLDYKKLKKDQFDSSYKKILDNYFRPFENFLYNERLSIRDPKYRPKCKYVKRTIENDKIKDDRVFLEVEDPPRQIIEAGNSVVPGSESHNKFTSARISDYDEFNSLLIFEEGYKLRDWPEKGTLLLEGDMASNRRKWNAIRKIKSRGLQAHAKLADALMRPWGLPNVLSAPRTYFNTDISHDNVESHPQATAIDIALSNNDVTLIHGPPGTGKTTVIVEIIRHVIANGGRVIMCAPTHVAVDNVLERTMDIKGISAVRVGGTAYMDDELQQFRLQEKIRSLDQVMPSLTLVKGDDKELKEIQQSFITEMEDKGKFFLEKLTIDQANLVCGTTIGIARFEPPSDNPIDFDVMIIDEASKTTVMEFLVPAVRAKKWVLVGDHRQLPPYVNEQEIRIYVQRFFENILKQENDNGNGDNQEFESDPSIYDEKTNNLIASLRRYHEETHALSEGQVEHHWNRIIELFEYAKKPIVSLEEMVNFALGSCFHYFLKQLDPSRNARLIVQHRMPSLLADFIDKSIYKGYLKTSVLAATHGFNLPAIKSLRIDEINSPMAFISTERLSGNEESPGKYKGYFNTAESEVIAEIISEFIKIDVKKLGYSKSNPMTIGVITYYAGQSREINRVFRTVEELEKERGWRYKAANQPIKVRVSIVDRFQGQEQDIVILSLTRSNKNGIIGFLKNMQRVNVSLSRAKQNLLIVGNARFFAKTRIKPDPILKELAKYAIRKNIVYYAMEDND
ncbi:MAG: ATP-dependent RecD-like DNA helicase [Candidatus Heimdallarchaeota archaeon LC_2]|nr:MAG: ATP-dependent RecD-like DNA helicase [Candidatus Heimdallarchaeota archaeon LC_2]